MGRYDVFYACRDHRAPSTTQGLYTLTGVQTLNAGDTTFDVAQIIPPEWEIGQIVQLTDFVGGFDAMLRVVRKVSATQFVFSPLRSSLDDADVIGRSYANGSVLVGSYLDTVSLVVDLTEAPVGPLYDYVICASGAVTAIDDDAVNVQLVSKALVDDPLGGDSGTEYDLATVTRIPAGEETTCRIPFNAVRTFRLTPGQRYEFRIMLQCVSADTATMHNARLCALRYDASKAVVLDQESTSSTTNTGPANVVETAVLPVGDYLVFASWQHRATTIDKRCRSQLRKGPSATTAYVGHEQAGAIASEWGTAGAVVALSFDGTETLRVIHQVVDSGPTSEVREIHLLAVLTSGLYGIATPITRKGSVGTDSGLTAGVWNSLSAPSGDPTIEAGEYLDFISNSNTEDLHETRPEYGAGSTPNDRGRFFPGRENQPERALGGFWFHRVTHVAGTSPLRLGVKPVGTTSDNQRHFVQLPIIPQSVVTSHGSLPVIAELEAAILPKNWSPTATGGRYRKHIPDTIEVSAVERNGVPMTEELVLASLGAGEWHWDVTERDAYAQLASGTPADDDQHIVIVTQMLLGREKADIAGFDGTTRPYEPRLENVPGSRQEVRGDASGRFAAALTLGDIDIAAADGEFDDLPARRFFEGRRFEVWRAITALTRSGAGTIVGSKSDFEQVIVGTLGLPSSNLEQLRLKLLDIGQLLRRPVTTTPTTVYEGPVARENHLPPVVYGKVLRLFALRTTNVTGAGNWNTFKFAAHLVYDVTAVYLDGTTHDVLSLGTPGTDADKSRTYLDVGAVRVKNDAFDDPDNPGDVVYVDVIGWTHNGLAPGSGGKALVAPGEIARDLCTRYGLLSSPDLVEPTFRQLDRTWRPQHNASTGYVRKPVEVGVVIETRSKVDRGETGGGRVDDALSALLGSVGAYWYSSREGRIGVGVPDLDLDGVVTDGGFERYTSLTWPWRAINSATFTTTTTRKFEGARSGEVSNGGTPNASAAVEHDLILRRPGTYVVTLMASLISGESEAFTLGVIGPGGEEMRSQAFSLRVGTWTRVSFAFNVAQGASGTATLLIYPALGSTVATTVAVDNVQMRLVAAVADAASSDIDGFELDALTFYEVAASYDVNIEDAEIASRGVVSDSEARSISTTEPEAKHAVRSSARLDMGLPLLSGVDSARGVAAAVVKYFGRMRQQVRLRIYGTDRVPALGDWIYHVLNPRIPEDALGYPLWRVIGVAYDGQNAKEIEVTCERHMDSVSDRPDIAPDTLPIGAIALKITSGAITDYASFTALARHFLECAHIPDATTTLEALSHSHAFAHVHPVAAHTHTATPGSPGATTHVIYTGASSDLEGCQDGTDVDPFIAQGQDAGNDHGPLHATSADVTTSVSGTSGAVSGGTTHPGPSVPKFYNVDWLQKTADTATEIDEDLVFMFLSATIPAGWTRETALDDYFLRGSDSTSTVSTTVATSIYTPSDSGSVLKVAAATNIYVGRILKIGTTPPTQMHVIVTAVSGTDITVVPLWITGDVVTTYAVSQAVASVWDDTRAQTFTPSAHNHGNAHATTHAHAASGHLHAMSASVKLTGGAPDQEIAVKEAFAGDYTVHEDHEHLMSNLRTAADATASSSAGISAIGDATNDPPSFRVVFIKPSGAGVKFLPAGLMAFWPYVTPPTGWDEVAEANDLMIRGAAASAGGGAGGAGHAHSFNAAAHTVAHTHGGSVAGYTDGAGEGDFAPDPSPPVAFNPPTYISAARGQQKGAPNAGLSAGHRHGITVTIGSATPDLTAVAGATSETDTSKPRRKRLMLIRKR